MERGGEGSRFTAKSYIRITNTDTHTHTHRSNFNFIHSQKRTIPSARQESRSTVYCIRALVCGQVYPVVWLDLQPDCVALRRVYRVFSPLKYRNAVFGRVSRKHRCKVHPDSIIHAPIVAFCVSWNWYYHLENLNELREWRFFLRRNYLYIYIYFELENLTIV